MIFEVFALEPGDRFQALQRERMRLERVIGKLLAEGEKWVGELLIHGESSGRYIGATKLSKDMLRRNIYVALRDGNSAFV